MRCSQCHLAREWSLSRSMTPDDLHQQDALNQCAKYYLSSWLLLSTNQNVLNINWKKILDSVTSGEGEVRPSGPPCISHTALNVLSKILVLSRRPVVERNSQLRDVYCLFVCRCKDPAEAPTEQIAALGKTTAFFLFFADTLHKWLSVCPACNWGLWMSSSVYKHFTNPFSTFFLPVRIVTLSHGPIIFSVIIFCSSRMPPTHQGGVGPFSHSA